MTRFAINAVFAVSLTLLGLAAAASEFSTQVVQGNPYLATRMAAKTLV